MTARTKIRVALVAPTLQLLGGHAVQAARLLALWEHDDVLELCLVPINPAPPRFLAWASHVKYARTLITQVCYWPLLFRALRRADVVHVFCTSNSSFFIAALPAILVATFYRRPVVANYRGDGREHLASSPAVRTVLRRLCTNVVPSEYFERIFEELAIPARIVPNVADLAQFQFRRRALLRPRILSTRNFEPIYNVACTLRAFARVQAAVPEAELVLVGGGREESNLRRLAGSLGLRNVTFAGRIAPADMHRYYDAADLYVQTPLVDNTPASVIEAFASGVPVVSTRVGGVPTILRDGVHGLLAPSDDHERVAAHVIALLGDPVLVQRLTAAAFKSCRAYAGDAVRERWRTVYRMADGSRFRRDPVIRREGSDELNRPRWQNGLDHRRVVRHW
jgi:glycosyltransferase involved in cell wall biosynthesis